MKRSVYYLAIALAVLLPINTFAGVFGPSNYWECILDEMPGVKNDPAAIEVIKKCRNDFSITSEVEKKLSIFGVKTAGECVLKYGRDISSPQGAKFVQAACYRLYKIE